MGVYDGPLGNRVGATSALDIQDALACWSRIEILVALCSPADNVTALAKDLGISKSLLSNHLGLLRRAKLVRYERRGLKRIYATTEMVTVSVGDAVVVLAVRSDDGSALTWTMPATAPATRLLSRGLSCARAGASGSARGVATRTS